MLSLEPVQPARISLYAACPGGCRGGAQLVPRLPRVSDLVSRATSAILPLSASRCFTPNARGRHSPLFPQMLERCDAVAAMTEHEKRFVERRSSQRPMRTLWARESSPRCLRRPDGRQIRTLYGIGDAPLVGYVGRMSATKGVVTLIEAMRIVWRRDPRVRLLLAGSGLPSSPRCDDDIRRAFAALSEAERSRIIFISGFDDDEKASIFDALDVFAMASVAESFGIAYLEAWMCRKAVIGSRIGSTECVIRDGVDGMLVTPNDPEHLSRVICELLASQEIRERMGCAGHEKAVRSFTGRR